MYLKLKVYVAHIFTPDCFTFENVLVIDGYLTEIKAYI